MLTQLRTTRVLHVKNAVEEFCFINIREKPIPSLLRNFSAPVKLNYPYTQRELQFLMLHDNDDFNQWHAGQQLMSNIILDLLDVYKSKREMALDVALIDSFKSILQSNKDKILISQILTLPTEEYLLELLPVADVDYCSRSFRIRET